MTIEAPLRLCGDFHCENVTYYFPHSKPQQLVEPKAFDVLLQPNLLSVLKINSPKTVKVQSCSVILSYCLSNLTQNFKNVLSVDTLGKTLIQILTE